MNRFDQGWIDRMAEKPKQIHAVPGLDEKQMNEALNYEYGWDAADDYLKQRKSKS